MEVSQVRRRLAAAIERARRTAQQRRDRTTEAQRAYETFLGEIAVPVTRMLASALKADGYPFTVATPGGAVRLVSDKGRDDYIEIALDPSADPPQVVGRTRYSRGSRTVAEERPVKEDASPQTITEEEFLEFLISAVGPWLER